MKRSLGIIGKLSVLLGALAFATGACGDRGEPPSSATTAKTTEALGEVGDPTCVPGGTAHTA